MSIEDEPNVIDFEARRLAAVRHGQLEIIKDHTAIENHEYIDTHMTDGEIRAYFDAQTLRDEMTEARSTPLTTVVFRVWNKTTGQQATTAMRIPEGEDARPIAEAIFPWFSFEPSVEV